MLSLVVALCGFSLVCSGVHSGYEKCAHDGLPFLLTVEVYGKKEQEALLESEDEFVLLIFPGLHKGMRVLAGFWHGFIPAILTLSEQAKNCFKEFARGLVFSRGLVQSGVAAYRL